MPHDGLAGVDLGYNMLNLTERISSSDTTLAEYAYLSDGTRLCASVVAERDEVQDYPNGQIAPA